jgi:hypothetical protein
MNVRRRIVLDPLDDYLIHQTAHPLRYAGTSDPRFFDRFYIGVHDMSGTVCVVVGLGVYPNNNSMDAYVVGVLPDSTLQRNGRFFREFDGPRSDTRVGPIAFEILEPMKRWHLSLGENPYGVEFDLEMHGRWAPWETDQIVNRYKGGVKMDMHHYVQANRYIGSVGVGGTRVDGEFFGMRDHSWGVREIGGVPAPGGSGNMSMWGLHLWLTAQFEDSSYFLFYDESREGEAIFLDGGIMGGPFDGRRWVAIEHDIETGAENMVHESSVLRLTDDCGEVHEMTSRKAMEGIYLSGAGYGSTHGVYYGDHEEGETWDLARDGGKIKGFGSEGHQPTHYEVDGRKGFGIFEHIVSWRHPRYGRKRKK